MRLDLLGEISCRNIHCIQSLWYHGKNVARSVVTELNVGKVKGY
jgi:hypothetical protein